MEPTYSMYAVVQNGIVIDVGFGEDTKKLFSPVTQKNYSESDELTFIQCTKTSGNFYFGQKID